MDPSQLSAGMPATDGEFGRKVRSHDAISIQAPIASRFGPAWSSRNATQCPIGSGSSGVPEPTLRHTWTGSRRGHDDEVEQAVEVQVDERRSRPRAKPRSRRRRGLDKCRPVAEEQVARVLRRVGRPWPPTLPFATKRSTNEPFFTSANSGCQPVEGSVVSSRERAGRRHAASRRCPVRGRPSSGSARVWSLLSAWLVR